MEEVLSSSGGTKSVISTLQYFKDLPAVKEAAVSSSQMMDVGNDYGMNDKLNAVLVWCLKDYLGMSWGVATEIVEEGNWKQNIKMHMMW